MAERYIEIFEENIENGKSKLSYYGYDHKMHDVGEADINDIKDSVTKMWEVMDTSMSGGAAPTPAWISKAQTITNNLTNVTTDNPVVRIEKGKPYEATLTLADNTKTFATCTVTISGVTDATVVKDVTGAANKKKIEIKGVYGNVVITATQST